MLPMIITVAILMPTEAAAAGTSFTAFEKENPAPPPTWSPVVHVRDPHVALAGYLCEEKRREKTNLI